VKNSTTEQAQNTIAAQRKGFLANAGMGIGTLPIRHAMRATSAIFLFTSCMIIVRQAEVRAGRHMATMRIANAVQDSGDGLEFRCRPDRCQTTN
jgi:hypothetical protein